ncbi:isoprenoid biosynthesis glyoxalase ElbB [Pseudomonas sp. RIT-PI-S]|uniref:isoprenoid biosynthesis glyoxalase ElbB n=1 Tax=Pseudomonas sp. RIT-PI-S TaxID=3035295 RepID=UPI0021DACC06|nr:isoprenoid biosynthesis glyoxalase ElbB [Pseudomonas sp. RIT-PI-S]
MTARIAVILSGCGFQDGAEIHESVLTLLRLDQLGCEVQCFAPDIEFDVTDHLTGKPTGERRRALVEAARIARGAIKPLAEAQVQAFDALIVPGGFGSACNLSNFATQGSQCTLDTGFLALAEAFAEDRKPVGLICISPALAAKIYGPTVICSIGKDRDTAAAIEKMGGTHVPCEVDAIVEDPHRRLVCTPAYMSARSIAEVAVGINKLVERVVEMVAAPS